MLREIADWDALAEAASEPNPFFESWYLLPSLRAFDPDGKVRIIRFERDGKLAGLMPIAHSRRYYGWPLPHLASWLHDNCFLGSPLVEAGAEHDFWRSLFTWADGHAGFGLFLHLAKIPLRGPLHDALVKTIDEEKRDMVKVHHKVRAMLESAQTPEDYFEQSVSAKKRKELRRQFTRLSELGEIHFSRRDDEEGLDRWIEDLLVLEAAGWKGRAGSALASSHATERLFRESLVGACRRGKLERLTLTLDGRPIAMLANFLTPPGAFSFKTCFDEALSRYSPGVLLQRENLSVLERDDIAWTDSCAAPDHPMIDHIWRERRAIGRFSIAIGSAARRSIFRRVVAMELSRKSEGPPK